MKIREVLEKFLFENGLWEEEAKQVVKRMETPDEAGKLPPICECLDKDDVGYPPQLLAVARLCARSAAINFLKETKPQHFALYLLESNGAVAASYQADPREAFGGP